MAPPRARQALLELDALVSKTKTRGSRQPPHLERKALAAKTMAPGSKRRCHLEHDRPLSSTTPSSQRRRSRPRDDLPTSNARPSPQKQQPSFETSALPQAQRRRLKNNDAASRITTSTSKRRTRLKANTLDIGATCQYWPYQVDALAQG
jgi:hypothetical protein